MSEKKISVDTSTFEQLKASELHFRTISENVPFGIFTYALETDDRLVLKAVNPAVSKILQFDCTQLLGKTIEEAFPPLAETEIPQRYREAAKNGTSWHTSQVAYQDKKIAGSYLVYAFNIGPNLMVSSFFDVTDLTRAEEKLTAFNQQLLASEQQLQAANQQLRASEQQLQAANQQLKSKEQALEAKISEMQQFNKLMVGRELDMIELKKRINTLLEASGKPKEFIVA